MCKSVDVAGVHPKCPGLGGGDRHEARPRGEIQHRFARDRLGMIENVARQGLAARPGEGPERRRQANLAQLVLGLLPEVCRLVGEIRGNFRRVRRRQQSGFRANEGGAIRDQSNSFKLRRKTFPTLVFGSSSRKMKARGVL